MEALEAKESKAIKPFANVEAQACPSCGGVDHVPSECPMLVCEVEQGNAIGVPSRFSNTYTNNGKTILTLVGGIINLLNPMTNGDLVPNLVPLFLLNLCPTT